ncbi:hypothetical protein BaRGS_00031488, partial [Batillaria attramentaria]
RKKRYHVTFVTHAVGLVETASYFPCSIAAPPVIYPLISVSTPRRARSQIIQSAPLMCASRMTPDDKLSLLSQRQLTALHDTGPTIRSSSQHVHYVRSRVVIITQHVGCDTSCISSNRSDYSLPLTQSSSSPFSLKSLTFDTAPAATPTNQTATLQIACHVGLGSLRAVKVARVRVKLRFLALIGFAVRVRERACCGGRH